MRRARSCARAVDASIEQSLAALKREKLDCLLLHRAGHMTSHGGAIWERLIERLEDGTVLGAWRLGAVAGRSAGRA